MRPRTKINPAPDPSRSEFQNFDRFMSILVTKKPIKNVKKTSASDSPKVQERERLPRP